MGIRQIISGDKGKKSKNEGTGEQRQFWGTGNIKINIMIFGEQGEMLIYFWGTREQVSHL